MATIFVLAFTFSALSAFAADSAAVHVFYGSNDNWHTHLLAECHDGNGCHVELASCVGPLPSFDMKFNDVRTVYDMAQSYCTSDPFGVFGVNVTGNATVSTEGVFKDAAGHVALAQFPAAADGEAFTPFPAGKLMATADHVQNDGDFNTAFFFANTGDQASIWATVYDEHGAQVGGEWITVPRGFTLAQLQTKVKDGRVEMSADPCGGFGAGNCNENKFNIYGLGFVNWSAGGSPRVIHLNFAREVAVP